MLFVVLLLALISGLLIGCVGIGGVLLVPALSLGGVPVHDAIAASMFSFLFSGSTATWLYARQNSIAWMPAAWLSAGAVPGALSGALLANEINSSILLIFISLAVAFSGACALGRTHEIEFAKTRELGPSLLVLIGLVIGLASALTGTGGPVLLVPLLMWLRLPVLTVVGLGQVIQVPIAALATLGNLEYGRLDFRLGALLAIGVVGGSSVGATIAHALPRTTLSRLVGIILLVVSGLLMVRNRHILFGS